MSGNGLFFEKSNDELIWLPGGREILEGGRASWLVPFGVINHYTEQNPRHEKEGEERRRKEERNPPQSPPRRKEKRKGRRKKDEKRQERRREGAREKKAFMGEKIIKSY